MKPKLQLYIDGSYRAKTNKGAYAVLAVTEDSKTIIASELVIDTTNNIMEMSALIAAMQAIELNSLDTYYDIEIFCDSQYVIFGLTKWYPDWERRGFVTAGGKQVKNLELWKQLVTQSKKVKAKLTWVKGHAETQLHNEVDVVVNTMTK
jgi:ribonuclease HI